MKKLAAISKGSKRLPWLILAGLYTTSLLFLFASATALAADECKDPPPQPQPPGAPCDVTTACFTNARGQQLHLPKKPCSGNYVCHDTNELGIGKCKCAFGSFEMSLFPDRTVDICQFIQESGSTPFVALVTIMNQLAGYLTSIIVALGLVMIIIGGYFYMTAGGGDASRISQSKKIIGAALLGIILALLGWLILSTISTQFTAPRDPLAILINNANKTQ